ncbi:MAG: ATP synthase F1 subunit delta [Proteobacteria bacterium]|nr:ATP synthase F1 subunit delta [Pseudomonadota bacterium]
MDIDSFFSDHRPYTTLAERYAKALFEVVYDNPDDVLEQLKMILSLFKEIPELSVFLTGQGTFFHEKQEVLQSLCQEIKTLPIVKTFINLLMEAKRLSLLENIVNDFEQLLFFKENIKGVSVFFAHPLTKEQQQEIQKNLERYFQCPLKLDFKEDKTLLAGLKVNYESYEIDLSLQHQIKNLSAAMKGQMIWN